MKSADTSKLMAYMASLWPSFKPTKETSAAWSSILHGQDPRVVVAAVRDFALNAETPFAPTPQEIFKTLRGKARPERRVFSKDQKRIEGPPEETLTAAESSRWFAAVHQHIAWVAAEHDGGKLDTNEVTNRAGILKEAWNMIWQQKRNPAAGWVATHEEKNGQ